LSAHIRWMPFAGTRTRVSDCCPAIQEVPMSRPLAQATTLIERLDAPGLALNSAGDELERHGYLEKEFTLSGMAGRYRIADFNAEAVPVDHSHAYRTRLLVRRPSEAQRFSGTVVVEWFNVSCGQDLDFVYGAARELILREGHAWLGVSVQRIGVERLVSARPERYAGLSVAAPLQDPVDGSVLDLPHPATGAPGVDVLGWDIFSDVARVLRDSDALDLGLPAAKLLIAAGESQSAVRLSHYFNSIQPLHGLYDGFLLYDRAGPMPLRPDVKARAISIGTDFFAEFAGASPSEDAENQRWWDLAGASHVSLDEMRGYIDPQVLRDGLQRLDGRAVSLTEMIDAAHTGPKGQLWSRVPNGDLVKAALKALERWISFGAAPPCAPRLLFDEPLRLRRDDQGRTMGGIRYPALEVPRAYNQGIGPEGIALAGLHLDFGPEEMTRRYSAAEAYRIQVRSVVSNAVAQGFLLPEEAERVRAESHDAPFQA
jgi:Alpha/beta hydrolase domain